MADVLGEGEIGLPVAGIEIVVEDAADAARLVAVVEEEILVAPGLVAGRSRRRGGRRRRPSSRRGRRWCPDRPACGAGRAPASGRRRRRTTPAGHDHAGVHVDGRHVRVPGGLSARCRRPRSAGPPRRRESPCGTPPKMAVDGRDVDADLLEDPAVEHRMTPPPPSRRGSLRSQGVRTKRPGGRSPSGAVAGVVLDRLEGAEMRSRSSANHAVARCLFVSMSAGITCLLSAGGAFPRRHTPLWRIRLAAIGARPRPEGRHGVRPANRFGTRPGLGVAVNRGWAQKNETGKVGDEQSVATGPFREDDQQRSVAQAGNA